MELYGRVLRCVRSCFFAFCYARSHGWGLEGFLFFSAAPNMIPRVLLQKGFVAWLVCFFSPVPSAVCSLRTGVLSGAHNDRVGDER